jgi:hypothetical protein
MTTGSIRKNLVALLITFVCGATSGLLMAHVDKLRRQSLISLNVKSNVIADNITLDERLNLDPSTIESLCQKRNHTTTNNLRAENRPKDKSATFAEQDRATIKNLQDLLPVAKELLFEEFNSRGYRNKALRRRVTAVTSVVEDYSISHVVEVDDRYKTEIFVAPDSLGVLNSEDTAILVLAHELTHVAARNGSLRRLISGVARTARNSAGIVATKKQEEDLACDFIGGEVLKRFIHLHPGSLTPQERLSRALGIEDPPTKLQRSLDEFCSAYNDDLSDDEHLSVEQTLDALKANDPDFR